MIGVKMLDLFAFIKIVSVIVMVVNILILLHLAYIYYNSYKEIKIDLTLGLLIFACVFMIKNILVLVLSFNVANDRFPILLFESGIELIAFVILYKMTLKY